jgi:hypothetical protein
LVGYERNQTVDRDLLAGANLRGLAFIHLASLFLSRLRGLHYDRTGLKNTPVFAGSDLGLVWVGPYIETARQSQVVGIPGQFVLRPLPTR